MRYVKTQQLPSIGIVDTYRRAPMILYWLNTPKRLLSLVLQSKFLPQFDLRLTIPYIFYSRFVSRNPANKCTLQHRSQHRWLHLCYHMTLLLCWLQYITSHLFNFGTTAMQPKLMGITYTVCARWTWKLYVL